MAKLGKIMGIFLYTILVPFGPRLSISVLTNYSLRLNSAWGQHHHSVQSRPDQCSHTTHTVERAQLVIVDADRLAELALSRHYVHTTRTAPDQTNTYSATQFCLGGRASLQMREQHD